MSRLPSLAHASLTTRLLVAALLVILVSLPLAGLGLAHHFRASATAAFDERLEALLNVVIAEVRYDELEQRLRHERSLGDPRFEQVFSGWYWQVSDGAERVLASRSLWDQRLPVQGASGPEVRDITDRTSTSTTVISVMVTTMSYATMTLNTSTFGTATLAQVMVPPSVALLTISSMFGLTKSI